MEAVGLAARFAVAGVLVVAGLAKAPRLREFEDAVRRYDIVPPRALRPVALLIPVLELSAGLLLAIGLLTAAVAWLIALLFCVFALAVASSLVRGREIDCGCFTPAARRRITWGTVLSNLVLAGLAVFVAAVSPSSLAVDGLVNGESGPVAARDAIAIAMAATIGLAAAAIGSHAVRILRIRLMLAGTGRQP